jgi:hypothetical protein
MKSQTIRLVKRGKKLVPLTESMRLLLEDFTDQVAEGTVVELYLDQVENEDEKTLGQLAKVHANVRELARYTGHSMEEMKDMVKQKAGLYQVTETGHRLKSFKDCSKEELSLAIETSDQIGILLGYALP